MPRFAPWYRREEYALIREIMDDRDTLPLNFDEWEKNAESERAAVAPFGCLPFFASALPFPYRGMSERRFHHHGPLRR
jgi:hypothetical protein